MESFDIIKRGRFCKFLASPRLEKLKKEFEQNGGKWEKFKLSSNKLFKIVGTKSLDEGKLNFVQNGINFVGRVNENNGIKGQIERQDFSPNEKNTISATVIGNYKYVKFQEEPYYCSQNVNKLIPYFKINRNIANYFITHILKFVSLYNGQQGGYKLNEIENHEIVLPIQNNKIAFDYMQKYIRELEEERIRELEEERIRELTAYLQVSDLEDYKLTAQEQNVINALNDGNIKFKEFMITGDDGIFEVKNTHSIQESWIIPNSGSIPYITAGLGNNSVKTYISYNKDDIEEGNSIAIGGKTLVITYQEKDYFSNDSHNLALYLKQSDKRTEKIQLFLTTCLYKSLKPKYAWNSSISGTKIKTDIVFLPVNETNKIDYNFIETYTKAIEKLVIKKVVLWRDKVINKTKEVVNL